MESRQPHPPPLPILVTDHTTSPPITMHYHLGDNTLSFEPIYKLTKSLLSHPPCSHSPLWPCAPCSTAFLHPYWAAAAHLLDYFADFAAHDNALMSSLWFHLLDIWQETSSYFPCTEILRTHDVAPASVQRFTAARWFLQEYRGTMGLFDMLIHGWGRERGERQAEQIVHVPSGDVCGLAGEYNTGPYVSGLRGWEQWLCAGGPGVALPALSSSIGDDGHGEESKKKEEEEEGKEGITRHIPHAAVALIHTYTTRLRRLAAQVNPDPDFLNRFDQNCLDLPTAPSSLQRHSYRSKITGRTVTYQLVNGTPPVIRYPGYGDPSMLCSRQDFTLLDECVAMCKGDEAYEPVSGEAKDEEEGEEDSDEENEGEDYNEEAFDVWTVRETKEEGDWEEKAVMEEWGELFDNWVEPEGSEMRVHV
jgi:hypothetical protein